MASEEDFDFTIFDMSVPMNKKGEPIVNGFGSTYKSMVIMSADDFKKLAVMPGLENVKWRVGR